MSANFLAVPWFAIAGVIGLLKVEGFCITVPNSSKASGVSGSTKTCLVVIVKEVCSCYDYDRQGFFILRLVMADLKY